MFENYQFKTDRNAQWDRIEASEREDGRAEVYNQKDKAFFYNGFDETDWRKVEPHHVGNLALYPKKTIAGWEDYFSYFKDNPLKPHQVTDLQQALLVGRVGRLHPQDDAYYVWNLWGEVWLPDSIIKIEIPTEEPIAPLDANSAYSCTLQNLTYWLRDADNNNIGSYLEYLPRFMDAMPPLLDARLFDFEHYKLRQTLSPESPVRIAIGKSRMKQLIRNAHGLIDPDDKKRSHKVAVAKNFFDVFDAHSDKLGEDFPRFIAEALEEE
ncbi:hypothetical protein [uncultured Microbulbifer sp.]|uniref:hypothetical protein n=1 Tax=uncultured Microbulbifer sp. TaxID=348147 RepID=UPI002628EE90|nr:hypothetical protein [uncultured Microbulbifer sp.]